jgi:hypothetical protein
MTTRRSLLGGLIDGGRGLLRRGAALFRRGRADGVAPQGPRRTTEMTVEDRPGEWDRLIAELATGVWRLRRRLQATGVDRPDQPRDELRRAGRDVEAMWDALTQAGVQVLDPTGSPYDPGQSLTVLAFQPTPGLSQERVIETVKPTVYLRARWAQMGEVIVGTPEAKDKEENHKGHKEHEDGK